MNSQNQKTASTNETQGSLGDYSLDAFKSQIPLLMNIFEEITPMLKKGVDRREIMGMAGVILGSVNRLLESGESKKDIRHEVEKKLLEIYGAEEAEQDALARTHKEREDTIDVTGGKVMVVDDSTMARRQIRYFLEKAGFDVFEAKSGEEALWLISEVEPDLLLLDVMMGGMDGIETCERIKANNVFADLPVIFLSAKGERKEIIKGFQSGAIDYIVKPFHPAESLSRIRTHLKVKKLAELRKDHIGQLEKLNQTKDRILRVASHDLRNPMAAIAGLTGFLKESPGGMAEEQQEIVNCIDDAAKSVVNLLNDLLDLSSMDNKKVELNRVPLDLCDVTRNIIPLFKGSAARKDIKVTFDAPSSEMLVLGDRHHLRRVLDNLVSNAIKFTPKGGDVRVAIEEAGDRVLLLVEDTGPGIPAKDADKIFNEFGTRPNKPTGGENSTGLGLSITKRLIEAHHGELDFVDRPGGGTRFRVFLPSKN